MREKSVKLPYHVTPEGGLGLLAMGDVGLQAWRKAKVGAKEHGSKKKPKKS